jgi:hypothetical protein
MPNVLAGRDLLYVKRITTTPIATFVIEVMIFFQIPTWTGRPGYAMSQVMTSFFYSF